MFVLKFKTGLWNEEEPCKNKQNRIKLRYIFVLYLRVKRNEREKNGKPLIGVMNLQRCKPFFEMKLSALSLSLLKDKLFFYLARERERLCLVWAPPNVDTDR